MQAVIVRTFEEPLVAPGGQPFVARIAGRRAGDGRWEAWVEFIPQGGGPVLRSARETTQTDLRNLEHWAQGLSRVYLEGSLERTALEEEAPARIGRAARPSAPHFEGPAPDLRSGVRPAPDDVALNPVVHYRHGEADLRRRVGELAASELRAIALAFHFDEGGTIDVSALDRPALEELIVAGARSRSL